MDSNRWRKEIQKLSNDELNKMIEAFKLLAKWEPFKTNYGGVSGILGFLKQDRIRRADNSI